MALVLPAAGLVRPRAKDQRKSSLLCIILQKKCKCVPAWDKEHAALSPFTEGPALTAVISSLSFPQAQVDPFNSKVDIVLSIFQVNRCVCHRILYPVGWSVLVAQTCLDTGINWAFQKFGLPPSNHQTLLT